MNYYLLTFNEDWADEHSVPALACMNEDQYNKWLKSPAGKPNKKYKEQLKEFQQKLKGYKKLQQQVQSIWKKTPQLQTDEDKKLIQEYSHSYVTERDAPKKVSSYIHASLGNSGEGFEENYSDIYLMEEFVADGTVTVTEVTEEFYKIFNKVDLASLSLCNIFDADLAGNYWGDDEEEDEDE